MLKLKYLFENFELAKHCIEYWEYDGATLEETLRWFRISSNAVYPFRQGEGLCFLRLCPTCEKPLTAVRSEIAVIRFLRRNGFAAMEPVPLKDGRLCAVLDTPWGSYTASCFRQAAGQPLEAFEASPELILGYGRCLGALHHALEGCPEGSGRSTLTEHLVQAGERLKLYHAPKAVADRCGRLLARLEALPRTPAVYGLIHYDFELDNVFFDPEDGQYSVIDFDDMLYGWHALDVVRALDGLDDLPAGAAPMGRAEQEALFLEGYRSCHSFTAEEEASMPLMREAVQLNEYAGLLHVLWEPVPHQPDWMEALRSRLTRKMHTLEQEWNG